MSNFWGGSPSSSGASPPASLLVPPGTFATVAALVAAAGATPAAGAFGYVGSLEYSYNPVTMTFETPGVDKRDRLTVATNGQTAFSLSQIPTKAISLALLVNGSAYELSNPSPAFTLAGTSITWTGPFSLSPSDNLVAAYT